MLLWSNVSTSSNIIKIPAWFTGIRKHLGTLPQNIHEKESVWICHSIWVSSELIFAETNSVLPVFRKTVVIKMS